MFIIIYFNLCNLNHYCLTENLCFLSQWKWIVNQETEVPCEVSINPNNVSFIYTHKHVNCQLQSNEYSRMTAEGGTQINNIKNRFNTNNIIINTILKLNASE